MKKSVVVGGASGLGLSISLKLIEKGFFVFIIDRKNPDLSVLNNSQKTLLERHAKIFSMNLCSCDYAFLQSVIDEADSLFVTAGFGRVCYFEDLQNIEINNLIQVNLLSPIHLIKLAYHKIKSTQNFYTAIISSISGHITSPLFSVYGASKSGLSSFIKNINVELIATNSKNRILDVSPSSFSGSSFCGGVTDLSKLGTITDEIISRTFKKDLIYIPDYDSTFKNVIEKDRADYVAFGLESYEFKIKNNRLNNNHQCIVGYLSGTFDLFHIGHLNLLKRAKTMCDFLIVGVHKSGSWKGKETYIPFKERLEIINSIKYVDMAVESFTEDSDAWSEFHFNKLFVGSDYKGSERFKRYEEYFSDKNVEIIYFPYTKGTSSTQLRSAISKKVK